MLFECFVVLVVRYSCCLSRVTRNERRVSDQVVRGEEGGRSLGARGFQPPEAEGVRGRFGPLQSKPNPPLRTRLAQSTPTALRPATAETKISSADTVIRGATSAFILLGTPAIFLMSGCGRVMSSPKRRRSPLRHTQPN